MLLANVYAFSQSFEKDGVYYNILSEKDKTLEIICIGNCCNECDNECSNFRILPKTIIYNNNSYTVTRSNSHLFKGFSSWNIVILPNFIINLLLVLIILLLVLVIV